MWVNKVCNGWEIILWIKNIRYYFDWFGNGDLFVKRKS